jgi:DNA-directed RNA polymerase subunit RPC12/RpoP
VKFQARNNLFSIIREEFPGWNFEDRCFSETMKRRKFDDMVCIHFDKELKKLDLDIIVGYHNLTFDANCVQYLISNRNSLNFFIELFVSTTGPFYTMKYYYLTDVDEYEGDEIPEKYLPGAIRMIRNKINDMFYKFDYKLLCGPVLDKKIEGFVNYFSEDIRHIGNIFELVFSRMDEVPWNIDYNEILYDHGLCDEEFRLLPEFRNNIKKIYYLKKSKIFICPRCKEEIDYKSSIITVEVTCENCKSNFLIKP